MFVKTFYMDVNLFHLKELDSAKVNGCKMLIFHVIQLFNGLKRR